MRPHFSLHFSTDIKQGHHLNLLESHEATLSPETYVIRSNSMSDSDLRALKARLNGLWIKYLGALDTYTSSHDELSKQLGSGYFALAQANARRTNDRRYGSDWYDERTKATIRAKIIATGDSEQERPRDELELLVSEVPIYVEPSVTAKDKIPSQRNQKSSPISSQAPRSETDNLDHAQALPTPSPSPSPDPELPDGAADEPVIQKLQVDPAAWYGLFVSPSLRRTQHIFKTAIVSSSESAESKTGDTISSECSHMQMAVNAARKLRAIEVDIRATRKAIRRSAEK